MLFSGNGNKKLAEDIAGYLGVNLTGFDIGPFPNRETGAQIGPSPGEEQYDTESRAMKRMLRRSHAFVIQSTPPPHTNDYLMETLIIGDTLNRSGVKSLTLVAPYIGYSKQDKMDFGTIQPISARLVADLIKLSGYNRVITFDLHAAQIVGFYNRKIPVDNLTAYPLIGDHLRSRGLNNPSFFSIDDGRRKAVEWLARYVVGTSADVFSLEKMRDARTRTPHFKELFDRVKGGDGVSVDDFLDTGGSYGRGLPLVEGWFKRLYLGWVHALLTDPAPERLSSWPVEELIFTDTVPIPEEKRARMPKNITVLSVAQIIAREIHELYEDKVA